LISTGRRALLRGSEGRRRGEGKKGRAPVDPPRKHRVAVAQDYLCAYAGGERVALTIAQIFDAPLYTSLYDPTRTFATDGTKVHASWLSSIGLLRADHRRALPLLAPVFSAMSVDADVTICTTAGWAHGVRATGTKVAYWESPAKWLHRTQDYQAAGTRSGRAAMAVLRRPLLWWDARAVRSVDVHIANSSFTRDLLRSIYGIEATVVLCPHSFTAEGIQDAVPSVGVAGYLLCVCRLLPYKNVDAVVAAMRDLPSERLFVVGVGPESDRLKGMAPPNVFFLGSVTDPELRWLYANCAAVVTASREDFGLTPLEAAGFGRPAIVLRWGGFLDTVAPGLTGVFFDSVDPEAVAAAIRRALDTKWESAAIRAHAELFSVDRFAERLRTALVGRLSS
jgi:glycosyltransferase involved in cell wall biosynthesis